MTNPAVIARAGRRILRTAPERQLGELVSVLLLLSAGRYTLKQLLSVIPREVVMGSSMADDIQSMVDQIRREFAPQWRAELKAEIYAEEVAKGRAEGRAKGLAEGALEGARIFVLKLIRSRHPEVAPRLARYIEACSSVPRLHRWGIAATTLSAPELVALVTKTGRLRVEKGRTATRAKGGRSAGGTVRKRAVRPARRSRRTAAK